MNEDAITRHERIYAHLRELHPRLFADRARLRRRSPAPLHVKVLWPLIEAIPGLSIWNKHRLCRLVRDPGIQLASRRRRPK